jgi:hypothetical protein
MSGQLAPSGQTRYQCGAPLGVIDRIFDGME